MNQPDLGEQAISKAAEVGIENQLDEVEDLQVDVRANPLDLVGGKLESVTIDGKGMVMQKELRAERLILQTDAIAINAVKAALGNIELDAVSLKIDKLDVGQGKIIMAASAVIREFPDS